MGEGRCAIPRRPKMPEPATWEREALRRVREPGFDPDEGYEWPGEARDTDDLDHVPE